jgi:ribonuclease P protein component
MQGQNRMGIDRMLFGFSATLRLLQAAQFKNVFDNALYKVHQTGFMLLAMPAQSIDTSALLDPNQRIDHPRLGLVIAKKKIRRAHERNRVKRLARESFRLHQAELPVLDIVLMAKADAQTLSNEELHEQLKQAWRQLSKRVEKNQTTTTAPKPAKDKSVDKKNTPCPIDLDPPAPNKTITSAVNPE